MAEDVVLEGLLLKIAGKSLFGAKVDKRWFTLTCNEVCYYTDDKKKKLRGTIPLAEVTCARVWTDEFATKNGHSGIDIVTTARTFMLYAPAESNPSADRWVDAIVSAMYSGGARERVLHEACANTAGGASREALSSPSIMWAALTRSSLRCYERGKVDVCKHEVAMSGDVAVVRTSDDVLAVVGESYTVELRDVDADAWATALESARVPAPPSNVQACSANPMTVEVSWTPSPNDRSVASYVITYVVEDDRRTTTVDKLFASAALDKLPGGVTVRVSVVAINDVGSSMPSPTVEVTVAADVPLSPSDVTITDTSTASIALEWTAPSDTRGADVISYCVRYIGPEGDVKELMIPVDACTQTTSQDKVPAHDKAEESVVSHPIANEDGTTSEVATNSGMRAIIEGLPPGVAIKNITVCAINAIGSSEASSPPVEATTKADVPVAPTEVKIEKSTTSSLDVSWTPTSDVRGADLVGYSVQYTTPSETKSLSVPVEELTGDGPRAVIEDLPPGVVIKDITVCALNAIGSSEASSPLVETTTKADVPLPPANLHVASTSLSSIALEWTAPSDTRGADIISYCVRYTSPEGEQELAVPAIAATADVGTSCNICEEFAPSLTCEVCGEMFCDLCDTVVHRGKKADHARQPIIPQAKPHTTLANLAPGVFIKDITVCAINAIGSSEASSPPVEATTGADVPLPPTDLRMTSTSLSSIVLEWTAPSDTRGADVISYCVRYIGPDGEAMIEVPGDTTRGELQSLRGGTTISSIRVHATSSLGPSETSNTIESASTTVAPPDPPTDLSFEALTANSVRLTWKAPASNGSPVSKYDLSYSIDPAVGKSTEAKMEMAQNRQLSMKELRLRRQQAAKGERVRVHVTVPAGESGEAGGEAGGEAISHTVENLPNGAVLYEVCVLAQSSAGAGATSEPLATVKVPQKTATSPATTAAEAKPQTVSTASPNQMPDLNDTLRTFENEQRASNIAALLDFSQAKDLGEFYPMEDGRRFLHNGPMTILIQGKKKKAERVLVLYNDYGLFCKERGKKDRNLSVKEFFFLGETELSDVVGDQTTFCIIVATIPYTCTTETAAEKQTWMRLLGDKTLQREGLEAMSPRSPRSKDEPRKKGKWFGRTASKKDLHEALQKEKEREDPDGVKMGPADIISEPPTVQDSLPAGKASRSTGEEELKKRATLVAMIATYEPGTTYHSVVQQQIRDIDVKLVRLGIEPPETVPSNADNDDDDDASDSGSTNEDVEVWVTALFDYTADNGDTLSFAKGDRFRLVSEGSAEWPVVQTISGSQGFVPRTYVEGLPPP